MWTLLCNCSYCSTSSVSRAGISKNEMRRHWTARKRGIRFPSRSCTDDGRVCQLCKVFSRRSLNSKCVDGHDVWYDMPRTPLPGGILIRCPNHLSFLFSMWKISSPPKFPLMEKTWVYWMTSFFLNEKAGKQKSIDGKTCSFNIFKMSADLIFWAHNITKAWPHQLKLTQKQNTALAGL